MRELAEVRSPNREWDVDSALAISNEITPKDGVNPTDGLKAGKSIGTSEAEVGPSDLRVGHAFGVERGTSLLVVKLDRSPFSTMPPVIAWTTDMADAEYPAPLSMARAVE